MALAWPTSRMLKSLKIRRALITLWISSPPAPCHGSTRITGPEIRPKLRLFCRNNLWQRRGCNDRPGTAIFGKDQHEQQNRQTQKQSALPAVTGFPPFRDFQHWIHRTNNKDQFNQNCGDQPPPCKQLVSNPETTPRASPCRQFALSRKGNFQVGLLR